MFGLAKGDRKGRKKEESSFPSWHGLSVVGDLKVASAHLLQVFGLEPRDAVAQARVGVVEAWQQNYRSAARRLSKVTEKDTSALDSLLSLIPINQRKRTAHVTNIITLHCLMILNSLFFLCSFIPRFLLQAAAAEASSVSSGGQWDQALSLLTVAVQTTGNHKLQYLRQRAACLSQLGLHERAIADLNRVILRHSCSESSGEDDLKVQAEDLCRRGRSLVFCSKDGPALEDFTKALDLHRDQAVQCIESGLGRLRAAECFLRGALQLYGEQQLDRAWKLIEGGLAVDSENTELRRLRARVKREVASPCNVN